MARHKGLKYVEIAFTPDEHRRILIAAAHAGISPSRFCRNTAIRGIAQAREDGVPIPSGAPERETP